MQLLGTNQEQLARLSRHTQAYMQRGDNMKNFLLELIDKLRKQDGLLSLAQTIQNDLIIDAQAFNMAHVAWPDKDGHVQPNPHAYMIGYIVQFVDTTSKKKDKTERKLFLHQKYRQYTRRSADSKYYTAIQAEELNDVVMGEVFTDGTARFTHMTLRVPVEGVQMLTDHEDFIETHVDYSQPVEA